MNKDIIAGNWKQFSGKVKEEWGKLTSDDLMEIDGKREKLLGRLQERYGYTKLEAEEKVNKFYEKHHEDKDKDKE